MVQDFLSDVELYYSVLPPCKNSIQIEGEEAHHISNVMRHKIGDEIFVTDGHGNIYQSKISRIDKNKVTADIIDIKKYESKFSNICFCIPRLRSTERFEFALEKCVELGITNFIVFGSQRTVAKGEKIKRWEKILVSAMKQSLRSWLPKISYSKSIREIYKLNGIKILFDQNAQLTFQSFLPTLNSQFSIGNCFFIFGPEGGFDEEELKIANGELRIKLTENRLRSETAIISAATLLASNVL